jgi:translation initiation factor IF-2
MKKPKGTHYISTPVKQASSASSEASAPPIITVLGHVDHGKTSLLDAIRKTSIAAREHGGITQKIGASRIEIEHEGKKRSITFIDTPGHEAFKLMRGRGIQAADIALLVVSAVDGVMPQTKESIQLIKASKIPYIVVLTKADLAEKQIEKTKGQLAKEEVLLEGAGGDVPFIEVSAKTGTNVKELLDLILLVSDMHPVEPGSQLKAIVIESKLDPKSGPKATVVVKSGSFKLREDLGADEIRVKVRSILDTQGKQVLEAKAGEAYEVLGFEKAPKVGSIVTKDLGIAAESVQELSKTPGVPSFDEDQRLKIILVADTQGSLEAIMGSLQDRVNVILSKTGDVEASDVLFAKSVDAVVLSFNVNVKNEVAKLAENEKILVRNYTIIYEMLAEIEDFLEGKAESLREKVLGKAQILAEFPFDKQKVLGIKVLEGRVAKGDRVRLIRDKENIVGESSISSVRQGKDPVSKVEQGQEAGILLSGNLDFRIGDVIISHA